MCYDSKMYGKALPIYLLYCHMENTFLISIGKITRSLPIVEIKPGTQLAILNILGDYELTEAAAEQLSQKLSQFDFDTIVTAETKSIPLAHALSVRLKKPYVVLRKQHKPYMGKAVSVVTQSITSQTANMLYLDEKDTNLIKGKQVALVDDVISTGATLNAMREIVDKMGGKVTVTAAICTEGEDPNYWSSVIALCHLPIFHTPS
jgi:adenine phosphoribosyltransferase